MKGKEGNIKKFNSLGTQEQENSSYIFHRHPEIECCGHTHTHSRYEIHTERHAVAGSSVRVVWARRAGSVSVHEQLRH